MWKRLSVVAAVGVLSLGASAALATAAAPDSTELCRLTEPTLTEISGLAISPSHEGIVWTHNDSGGGPRIYAIDTTDCSVRAVVRIQGIEARDIEAIGAGVDSSGRPELWVADIGDNTAERKNVFLHRLSEPVELIDQSVKAQTYAVRYDRPSDAEALIVGDDALWIVTKGLAEGSVLRLDLPLRSGGTAKAVDVGTEEGLVTDAAMSPNGSRYVVRDYTEARIYSSPPPGQLLARLPLPDQVQGEAVTWTADGTALLIASENDDRLLQVPLPPEAQAGGIAPVPEPTPQIESTAPSSSTEGQIVAPTESPSFGEPSASAAAAVFDPAEQLGSMALIAVAASGGVFVIATMAVIIAIVMRDRTRRARERSAT